MFIEMRSDVAVDVITGLALARSARTLDELCSRHSIDAKIESAADSQNLQWALVLLTRVLPETSVAVAPRQSNLRLLEATLICVQ